MPRKLRQYPRVNENRVVDVRNNVVGHQPRAEAPTPRRKQAQPAVNSAMFLQLEGVHIGGLALQIHNFVVAKEQNDAAAVLRRLSLQRLQILQRAHGVLAPVHDVTGLHESAAPARPRASRIG